MMRCYLRWRSHRNMHCDASYQRSSKPIRIHLCQAGAATAFQHYVLMVTSAQFAHISAAAVNRIRSMASVVAGRVSPSSSTCTRCTCIGTLRSSWRVLPSVIALPQVLAWCLHTQQVRVQTVACCCVGSTWNCMPNRNAPLHPSSYLLRGPRPYVYNLRSSCSSTGYTRRRCCVQETYRPDGAVPQNFCRGLCRRRIQL